MAWPHAQTQRGRFSLFEITAHCDCLPRFCPCWKSTFPCRSFGGKAMIRPKGIFSLLATLLAFSFAIGTTADDQSRVIKRVPIQPVSPASGRDMYMHYCAVCHGRQGRGGGPAAGALKAQPADLTTLAQRNHGQFPRRLVEGTLR